MNFSALTNLLGGEGGAGQIIMTIVMVLGVGVFFYFFMIRPQKKQEKKDAEMRDALAVGDEVTTIGGIIGKVVSIKGETFVLETTKDKTKIRFLKGAIRTVDVKAADIAAAIIDGGKTEEAPAEDKASKKKSKKASAEEPASEAPVAEATTDESK